MLAPEEEAILGWNSNGGPNLCQRKLVVGEEVEVRSVEEGFLGSWYLGTVIASKKRCRRIKYDHIYSDDDTGNLVETVDVSEVIDGLSSPCTNVPDTLRGRLRPVPPKLEVDKRNLTYGLCVDVFLNDAWWEGVLFDSNNGSEQRRVFFPDLGDEMNVDLQSLRITQDWDEGTEKWDCRGRWVLLELIEKFKEENYLPVSVEQLWYDIRDRTGFARIQEWTCSTRHLWEELMLEVIDDNLRITINHFLHDYDAERYPHQEFKLLKKASQLVDNTNVCPRLGLKGEDNRLVIAPQEQEVSCIEKYQKPASERCQSLTVLTSISAFKSEASYISEGTEFSTKKSTAACTKITLSKKIGDWQPFDCVAKICPPAVSSYLRKASQKVVTHVRKHLKYLGWAIEHMVDEGGRHRFRYLSPDGRLTEYSLRQVCLIVKQHDESVTPQGMDTHLPLTYEKLICSSQETWGVVLAVPSYTSTVALGDERKLSAEALLECKTQGKEEVIQREGRNSCLRNAASLYKKTDCIKRETKTKAQGFLRLKNKRKRKPNLKYVSKKEEVGLQNVNLSTRRGKTSRMLMDIKKRVIGRGKTRVLQSSKRVQRVITPTSKHQSPRSTLSWLIDNNVVLPRENIRFQNQMDASQRKEGKLTRDGIKCSCCRRTFTMSGFEVHADGGSCRAAANIFLDDGRSLLECQIEAYKTRKKAQSPDDLEMKFPKGENDVICAVCHYGGKLILCDACPSAFHAICLGLQGVPDGDWFCPSCCCGACGQEILKGTSKYAKEEHFISCKQCELIYHRSCLHYDGNLLDTFSGEKSFCSKDCEEVFVNLCEVIGKPREVGIEKNLTWRLVQSLEPDTYEINASNIEAVAENHCKLSVALEVMHELFEPVKKPLGGGDLAENVIFSKWSEYKRLNFSGFYTVLLERNDELVTVATVRILGKKVAEMPFIGTRFQYRQLGMCRILMNELEKVLVNLGVERLVLPAVPCVLNTWTGSFGFTKMTNSQRKEFLQFAFLEFGRTIMCQKILTKNRLADPIRCTDHSRLEESPPCNILSSQENSVSDDRSEVYQADQYVVQTLQTREIKTHEEKDNRFSKYYSRRNNSKRMRLI